jgi:hypothetical protein
MKSHEFLNLTITVKMHKAKFINDNVIQLNIEKRVVTAGKCFFSLTGFDNFKRFDIFKI